MVDQGNHRIERFDADGHYLSTIGTNTGGAGELDFPGDVGLGHDGRIYVCDTRDHHIHVYNATDTCDAHG
ncbi:MAG TPA: hypothetical protein PL151_13335 [Phycisphaerae bacterium]|nr:hypothetical protein [Phycisphaerae bacterium]HOJ72519.1 hypothetical protein [Phycisphaerae bacterium]HOM49820.1 hypothetical protein [Phycisphaerae bacterium]HON67769.1 hypothetical protein [Phycisphaerae bacterium]HOQ84266.1 hypothetical protein [Phycisphaerae bacterium]